jgi:PAS domain S-box-containing protein
VRDVALYFVDSNGTVRNWNPGAERLHGFQAEEIAGQHHSIVFTDEDRSAGVPEAQLRTAERDGFAKSANWLVRKDGTRFWAESSRSAVRDEQGQLVGFACVTHDASDHRRLSENLERTTEELNGFAFVVSHDLQEPVRTMKSYGELLARRYKGKLDSDADEFINFMTEAGTRMTQLLKDLLSYSQAGRPDRLRPEVTPASSALQWAIMNLNPLIKETSAVITNDPLPAVHADQAQLAQLFQQLLTNSLRFRSKETPKIHIRAARHSETHYLFSVCDNGVGIAKEFHQRIFGVFKRLHGKDVPGTGIGLAVCRKIVEAHNGQIWVESDAGHGATFHFILPAGD